MVRIKFGPFRPNSQDVRTIRASGATPKTSCSPLSFDLPYPRRFLLVAAACALVGAFLGCAYTRLPRSEVAAVVVSCYAALLINFWPFVILEAVWTFVSVYGLIKTMKVVMT